MKLEDVLDIPATGTNRSHPVKLGSLVTIEPGSAPVEVNHVSLARVFDVLVNTEDRDIGGVAGDIQGRLQSLQDVAWQQAVKRGDKTPAEAAKTQGMIFPDGMRINLRGEYGRMNESFGSLGFGLAMAVGAGLSAAGRAVPLVRRPVHHHVRRAAGVDRRADDAVPDRTRRSTCSRAWA